MAKVATRESMSRLPALLFWALVTVNGGGTVRDEDTERQVALSLPAMPFWLEK
jgi:hypothetical protein